MGGERDSFRVTHCAFPNLLKDAKFDLGLEFVCSEKYLEYARGANQDRDDKELHK